MTKTTQTTQDNTGVNGNNRLTPAPKKEKRSRKFCFTTNNYNTTQYTHILDYLITQKFYVVGKEVGESGTPHLQGYVETNNGMTLKALNKKIPNSHIEVKKKTDMAAALYCMKDGDYTTNITKYKPMKKVKDPLEGLTYHNYQQEIIDTIGQGGDDRIIHWYYEGEGNVGKSAFCKHLCLKYLGKIVVLDGKKSDMFNCILQFKELEGDYPEIVIVDTPRSIEHISYGGIEQIKNGCFYSGKYEGGMVLMNQPIVIIFSNQRPEIEKMSADRWNIQKININENSDSEDDVDSDSD